MQRDNLDFKNMSVGKLSTRQLFPALLGILLLHTACMGVPGIWLAVAAGDITTTVIILLCRKKK